MTGETPKLLVSWLQDRETTEPALAGGKGVGLAVMTRAGLPVPRGFVVTTDAYRRFVEEAGLGERTQPLLDGLAASDPTTLEDASVKLRRLIESGPIPDDVATAITGAYAGLGGGPVAVRSSATAEDLPEASFAGQQETFLNVVGAEEVRAAVRRCWSSLWTARAIAYRASRQVPHEQVAVAVVVQRMVPAEAAGVLFTADPVTGRRDRIVIEAAAELGERLVKGAITPDRWELDGVTGTVLRGHERDGVLDDGQLGELAALGRQAARLLASPQDLEWAVARGRCWLLQSRPITTLLPPPQPPPPPEAGTRMYLSFNLVGQGLTEPLTPMGLALFRALLQRLYGSRPGQAPWFTVSLGRAYIDITGLLRQRWFRTWGLGLRDPVTAAALQRWLDENPDAIATKGPARGTGFPLRLIAFELRTLPGLVTSLLAPERARRRPLAYTEAALTALDRRAESLRGTAERLAFVEETVPYLILAMLREQIGAVYTGLLARALAESVVTRWLGRSQGIDPVLRSLPYNPTTEMGLALWQLSRRLRSSGQAASPDDPRVRDFLRVYGHRAVREIDVGVPRWAEDPSYVVELLTAYLRQDEDSDPRRRFVTGLVAAERAVEELVAEARRQKGGGRAWALRVLLRRTRALVGLRERPKFDLVRAIAVARRVLLELGAEFVADEALERAEDVVFCYPEDLRRGGDLRSVAASKRGEYERELGRRTVPRLMTSDGEAIYGAASPASGALVGTPVSPGVYEGPVRVVEHAQGARLEPGEVLVAATTDPGWTPLFLTAGALVMEVGGVMSHGSVVAREYGIPAVVGITDATRRLRTGERVRVSGDDGSVVRLGA